VTYQRFAANVVAVTRRLRASPWRKLVALTIVAASLAACSGNRRGGAIPYNVADFGRPDAPRLIEGSEVVRIGPGDELVIEVYRVPALSRAMIVDASGYLDFPLLGDVAASGLTSDELEKRLEAELAKSYLQDPDVNVTIKSSPSQRVTLDGAVASPGMYPVPPGTTLLQAVALAGGASEEANLRRVVVFRTIDGQRMAAAFDLLDVRRGLTPDPQIYGRDIIVIDGSALRAAYRDLLSTVPLLAVVRPF